MDIGPPELIILAVLLLVVFGGSKIPQLARNLGKAQSEFKKGLEAGTADGEAPATSTHLDTPTVEAVAADTVIGHQGSVTVPHDAEPTTTAAPIDEH